MTATGTARLSELVRGAGTPETRAAQCELCAAPLPDEHRHVLDLGRGELLCACRACSILFDRDAAGGGHYRLVPDDRHRLTLDVDEHTWKALGVPVGLAFFVRRGAATVAVFPSPGGPTETEVDEPAWDALTSRNPRVGELVPDVEALLVNRLREQDEQWIVPIDDCYRLVGVLRTTWRGITGGDDVWPAVGRILDEIRTTARQACARQE